MKARKTDQFYIMVALVYLVSCVGDITQKVREKWQRLKFTQQWPVLIAPERRGY